MRQPEQNALQENQFCIPEQCAMTFFMDPCMGCRHSHTQHEEQVQAVSADLQVKIRNTVKQYGKNSGKDAGVQKKGIRIFSPLEGLI